jgi:nitrogenase-associated protein
MMFFSPNKILFYEKVGCAGNAKQKKLLQKHKIDFETIDILNYNWDKEKLLCFFHDAKKEEMINPFAPSIKNNLIDISKLTKDELLEQMLKEPILIKRPLIEFGEHYIYGFEIDKINKLLQSNLSSNIPLDICQSVGNNCG